MAADIRLLTTGNACSDSAAATGYTGYRVKSRTDGTWTNFFAGDQKR